MSAVVGYLRVSTADQTNENQRQQIAARYCVSKWFEDHAVSGKSKADTRSGFGACLSYLREGDLLVVAAIDRLGRNSLDILATVEQLQRKGVSIVSVREGFDLATPIGKAMLTMLSAVAELELAARKDRQMAGIKRARQEGRALGRPCVNNSKEIRDWRSENNASISETALHFGISVSTVKRSCQPV